MKVYVVKTLWRNDEDFGSYVRLYKTLDKAKARMEQEIKDICVDYGITKDDMEFGDLWTEYEGWKRNYDRDYAFVDITLTEVD